MPAQSIGLVLGTHDGNGLMRHDHAQLRRTGLRHKSGHTVDLPRGYLTIFVSPGSRGVAPHHHEVRRAVHGLKVRPERGAVPSIRASQAGALCDVARQDKHIRALRLSQLVQGLDDCALPAAALTTNWRGDAMSISGAAAMAHGTYMPFPASTALQKRLLWQRVRK